MVGVGVWMGWDIQEVPGGAGGNVVAGKFGSSFIVQVIFVIGFAYISLFPVCKRGCLSATE